MVISDPKMTKNPFLGDLGVISGDFWVVRVNTLMTTVLNRCKIVFKGTLIGFYPDMQLRGPKMLFFF